MIALSENLKFDVCCFTLGGKKTLEASASEGAPMLQDVYMDGEKAEDVIAVLKRKLEQIG